MHQMAGGDVEWMAIREDFPILRERAHGHPLIYFDSAATSQKPQAVLDALRNYYEHNNANVHRGLHELSSRATEAYETSRQHVAKYIGAATADEIIFTRGTTEGINLVAQAWGGKFLHAGDVILLTEMEHHSNLVPWQLLAARTGVRLRFVPVRDDGTLALEELPSLLTPEVKLFAFTHISNSLGTINPVAKLCQKARALGVLTLVDAAQSAGHLPVDVQELGCDFLAFSGHKMCGPTGIGVLYGRAELLDAMPPWHGGGEMIVSVTLEKSVFKKAPHRFEAGTPNIAGAIGPGAAIEYIVGIGRAAMFEHDGRRIAGDQIHRTRLRDQSGIRLIDDDEIEREKPLGSRGDAARLSRFGDGRNGRGAADVGRSSNDAGRAEISSAGQVRHAGLAGGRAGVAAKRRRSDYFDRNRFRRAATPWFARLGGANWKERCLTRRW